LNLTCHDCPSQSACSEVGFTLNNLPISRGHFRFSAHNAEIVQCPGFTLCTKGKTCACAGSFAAAVNATSATTSAVTAGDALCAAHSSGPFCMLCEDGYYRKGSSIGTDGTGCSSCDEDKDVVAATMSVIMIIIAIMLVLSIFRKRTMDVLRLLLGSLGINAVLTRTRGLRGGPSQVSYAWWRLVLMQMWYMLQSMSRYVDSQNITFPDPMQTFMRVTHLINLDVGIVPSTACVFTFDFYDVMMTWSLLPLIVVGVGALRVGFLKLELTARTLRQKPGADDNDKANRADQRKFRRGVESAVAGAMLVVCIFHSSVCAAVIDFFNCDPPTGDRGYEVAQGGVRNRFLVKDYSISCNSTKYQSYLPYASIMLFIYAVVFPCLLAYYVRRQLATAAGGAGALSFLTGHLRARSWWYEIVALDVRLLLGGALYPVIQHSGLHITVVLLILMSFSYATREIDPYLNKAGGSLRTSTGPTLNLLLFLRTSV
jgi:hypothetical protein